MSGKDGEKEKVGGGGGGGAWKAHTHTHTHTHARAQAGRQAGRLTCRQGSLWTKEHSCPILAMKATRHLQPLKLRKHISRGGTCLADPGLKGIGEDVMLGVLVLWGRITDCSGEGRGSERKGGKSTSRS